MLGIECLFHFTSREQKDSILNNYDGIDSNPVKPLAVEPIRAIEDEAMYEPEPVFAKRPDVSK
jgi:hypothetical protein